jgi:hypothetical protein
MDGQMNGCTVLAPKAKKIAGFKLNSKCLNVKRRIVQVE